MDQAKALAFVSEKNAECPECHTRDDEWRTSDGKFRHAYEVAYGRCEGCALLHQGREDAPKNQAGLQITLLPVED